MNVVYHSPIGKQWMMDMVEDVKSKVASAIHKDGKVITADKIGVDAIIKAMAATASSNKLSVESITAWFVADLSKVLSDAIKAKVEGIAEDKLKALLDSYLADFVSLVARNASLSDSKRIKLEKALALIVLNDEYESIICSKIVDKMAELQAPTESIDDAL